MNNNGPVNLAGAGRCTKQRKGGGPCAAMAIAGTDACRRHSGRDPQTARARGAVVVELRKWGLDSQTDLRDPGETLLRLVTQSAVRVELYARLLGEAYEAAERLREAREVDDGAGGVGSAGGDETGTDSDPAAADSPAAQMARTDLNRVFGTGGVAALIGTKKGVDSKGRVYDTEEAIRGLAMLEAAERDRCATFASKAVAAGLAERQVRIAEQQGSLVAGVIRAILGDLGLSAEQEALAPALVVKHLRAIAGEVATIQGEVVER